MKHTEHIANFCSDQGVLDILEEIGEYLDSIDLKGLKPREGRQNRIEWKTAVSDNYLSTFRKTVRPGPPWHQKIVDLLLDLNQRNRNTKMADLATSLGSRITGRKQALSAIYPPGGYLSWHHNADVPGRNIIFTWSKTGEGLFRYKNYTKGYNFDIPDYKGWNVKSFDWFSHGESEKEGYSWHCAGTECLRATLAFVIHSNRMSDEMLEDDFNLTPWSPGCFIGDTDLKYESKWWENTKDSIINYELSDDLIDELDKSPSGVKYGPR
jgi:hypothetical protein